MAGISYREIEFQLQSGDVLVFMTDGIIEAKDSSGQEYQETDRLSLFSTALNTGFATFSEPKTAVNSRF